MALLEGFHKADVGASARTNIGKYLHAIQPEEEGTEATITKFDIEMTVHFIRLKKCHDEKKTKLMVGAPSWTIRPVITAGLKREGAATYYVGPAPPGWLEDEISSWFDRSKEIYSLL